MQIHSSYKNYKQTALTFRTTFYQLIRKPNSTKITTFCTAYHFLHRSSKTELWHKIVFLFDQKLAAKIIDVAHPLYIALDIAEMCSEINIYTKVEQFVPCLNKNVKFLLIAQKKSVILPTLHFVC